MESDEAFQSPDENALLFSTSLMPDVSKIAFMLTLQADLGQVHQNLPSTCQISGADSILSLPATGSEVPGFIGAASAGSCEL